MKKQILSVLTMLSLVAAVIAAVTVTPAAAQAFHIIKVDVPFGFSSGTGEFPAGKYTIKQHQEADLWIPDTPITESRYEVWIKSEDGKASGKLMGFSTEMLTTKDVTSLVFNRYADHYFLSQIWTAGETTGIEIPRSSMERRFQRAIQAGNGASAVVSGPAIVTIAAAMPIAR
jgi:hypothetical protein